MRAGLAALGHPERRLPAVIHVAGTNGKGSTIAILRAVLEADGRRVHTYTSPHLASVREAIRLAGTPGRSHHIGDAELTRHFDRVGECSYAFSPTAFEALTLAAFLAYAEHPADFLLLETGLGGRDDATNVVDAPVATVITRISHDHRDLLGDSLAGIAAAKAGIVKPGTPVIVAPQADAEVVAVIEAEAKRRGAPVTLGGRDWRVELATLGFRLHHQTETLLSPRPALLGDHQMINAGTALATLKALETLPGPEAIARGMAAVRWPGRLQRIDDVGGAAVWLDGGHNDSGAAVLADWARNRTGPVGLVVGMLGNKDVTAFLGPLAPLSAALAACSIGDSPRRAHEPAHIAEMGSKLGIPDVRLGDSARLGVEKLAAALGPGATILVCGSLHLLPEFLGPDTFLEDAET